MPAISAGLANITMVNGAGHNVIQKEQQDGTGRTVQLNVQNRPVGTCTMLLRTADGSEVVRSNTEQ